MPQAHDCLQRVRKPSEQSALEVDLAALRARASSSPFGLVAVAPKARIQLWAGDSKLWAWSQGLQASANGDGPLVSDDTLKGLPYHTGKQSLILAGAYPNLLALLTNDAPCASADFAVSTFVRQSAHWSARPLPKRGLSEGNPPHGFVTWMKGGLLIDSAIPNCGAYTSGGTIDEIAENQRGTTFTYLASDGNWSHPTLGLDPTFVAWGASSAGDALSLVGSFAVHPGAAADRVTAPVVVMRRNSAGPFRASAITPQRPPGVASLLTQVREFGSAALLLPPPVRDDGTPPFGCPAEVGDEMGWKGHAGSVFIVSNSETKELAWRTPAEQDCYVPDAVLNAEGVFAIFECPMPPDSVTDAAENYVTRVRYLLHVSLSGGRELTSLPEVGGFTCEPDQIELRPPDDLWVSAACGGGASGSFALFRRGHPQLPLVP